MNIRVELATILTTTLDMDQAMLDLSIAPAANAGIFAGYGISNFDEFMVAREELIGLTRKAEASNIGDLFITDQWKVYPIEAVESVEGEDEIVDPISGSVLVEGKDAVEGRDAVEGEITSLRSAINSVETVINDEFLPAIHVEDAAGISFVVEFIYDSETEHRYTARPALSSNLSTKKTNGGNGGGNGGNGGSKAWKANCWKEIKPETSNTKARILKSMCLNAGVDVSDLPSKVEEEHVEALWYRCASGYDVTGDHTDYTVKGLANHYETIRMSDNRPVFSE